MTQNSDLISAAALEKYRLEFSEMLIHVLRNQVAAMGGYADLVASSGELNEDQSLFLERVQSGTDRLNRMLPALVELIWLEAGIPLQPREVAFAEILEAAVAELATQSALKVVQVLVSIDEHLPVISGDRTYLQQALTEILRNALVYSPSRSSVSIRVWNDKKNLYCSVSDQGIGISGIDQELIFDRLYRSSDPRVREIQGSGLGLTLANRIIHAHGGELNVSSQLDQGSTFTLMLPLPARK